MLSYVPDMEHNQCIWNDSKGMQVEGYHHYTIAITVIFTIWQNNGDTGSSKIRE